MEAKSLHRLTLRWLNAAFIPQETRGGQQEFAANSAVDTPRTFVSLAARFFLDFFPRSITKQRSIYLWPKHRKRTNTFTLLGTSERTEMAR